MFRGCGLINEVPYTPRFTAHALFTLCCFSFCKGETLYTLIHIKKDTFKINKAMIIASQVAQVCPTIAAILEEQKNKNKNLELVTVVTSCATIMHKVHGDFYCSL
jgi:hypothetical protein